MDAGIDLLEARVEVALRVLIQERNGQEVPGQVLELAGDRGRLRGEPERLALLAELLDEVLASALDLDDLQRSVGRRLQTHFGASGGVEHDTVWGVHCRSSFIS